MTIKTITPATTIKLVALTEDSAELYLDGRLESSYVWWSGGDFEGTLAEFDDIYGQDELAGLGDDRLYNAIYGN